MPNVKDWKRFYGTFTPEDGKQVDYVEFEIAVDDCVIRDANNQNVPIYFTDFLFQPGNKLTGWVPEAREMLAKLTHSIDEFKNRATVNDIYEGSQPQVYTNLEKRWYNIVGRGHTVITLPNYYPEDWTKEILPTGVDFTIYPKEDFDLMRISTNVGVLVPEDEKLYRGLLEASEEQWVKDTFEKHPLHYRYTREFWVKGGAAGDEIKIHASTRTASVNGNRIQIEGDYLFDWNTGRHFTMPINRKRFMLTPKGSVRFRVEFYGSKNYTLKYLNDQGQEVTENGTFFADTGIGFYGTAEFVQWTYGKARA